MMCTHGRDDPKSSEEAAAAFEQYTDTASFQTKDLQLWSLSQANS